MELLLGCCAGDKENLQNTAMTKTPSPSIYLQESKTQHQFFFWFFLSGMEIEVTGGTTISLKHTHSLKHIHTPINQIPSPHTSQFQKPLLLETKERLLQIINLGRRHHKSPQNSMIQAERNTKTPNKSPKEKRTENRNPTEIILSTKLQQAKEQQPTHSQPKFGALSSRSSDSVTRAKCARSLGRTRGTASNGNNGNEQTTSSNPSDTGQKTPQKPHQLTVQM